jgi:hypothetical protein
MCFEGHFYFYLKKKNLLTQGKNWFYVFMNVLHVFKLFVNVFFFRRKKQKPKRKSSMSWIEFGLKKFHIVIKEL